MDATLELTRGTARAGYRPPVSKLAPFLGYLVLFWGLRGAYWTSTYEAPFSDIADYVWVGTNIASQFLFGASEQLYAYYAPVTPTFIAIARWLGGGHFEATFRLLVQAITFCSALLLAYELAMLTGRAWLGWALPFIVALSRPSIFWSLKLSTEPVSEALLLATVGLTLRALRTRRAATFLVAGAAAIAVVLNRPQFLPSVVVLGAALLALRPRRNAVLFALGVGIVWSPWIVRNALHYGALVPLSTSGSEILLWEQGVSPVKVGRYDALQVGDLTLRVEGGFSEVRRALDTQPTEVDRMRLVRRIWLAWAVANKWDLHRLYVARLKRLVFENGASGLTQVPRSPLFAAPPLVLQAGSPSAPRWLEAILLDKSPITCLLALGGTVVLLVRHRVTAAAIASFAVLPWFVLATLTSYERTVESMISLTLWLALYGASAIVIMIAPWRPRGAAPGPPAITRPSTKKTR